MGNKPGKNKKQLETHQQEDDNKYGDETDSNPFDRDKQQRVISIFDEDIKPNYEPQLTSTELVDWISTYIDEEQYTSRRAIFDDLNDVQYSDLRATMEETLQDKANEDTVNAIVEMLKHDIFNEDEAAQISRHRDSISSTINDSRSTEFVDIESEVKQDPNPAEFVEEKIMDAPPFNFGRQKSTEVVVEDEYDTHQEPFPEYINVALFGRSDDEYLEMLIDKALLTVCYSKPLQELWGDREFIQGIYNNNKFPDSVNKVYNKINHNDDTNNLEYIGRFVSKQFKRQINENKRKIEEKAKQNKDSVHEQHTSTDVDEEKGNIYNVTYDADEDGHKKYIIHTTEEKNPKTRARRNTVINRSNNPLFKIQIHEDNDDYCWALFRELNKKKLKKLQINNAEEKPNGYWDIITKEADEKREDKRKEEQKKLQKEINNANARKEQYDKKSPSFLSKSMRMLQDMMSPEPSIEPPEEEKYGGTLYLSPRSTHRSFEETVYDSPKQSTENLNKEKKKKFQIISLLHLNVIFELLQFHYIHSIKETKEKKSIASKQKRLVKSPLYEHYCAAQEFDEKRATIRMESEGYHLCIDGMSYDLQWWNFKGRSECNAFEIVLGGKHYRYMRFQHRYVTKEKIDRMVWDWYDNDHAKYRKYDSGEQNQVYKELEASFQSNVDDNFPVKFFTVKSRNDRQFGICMLPKLKKLLIGNKRGKEFVLRFTHTGKTNRILNIEQVAISSSGSSFPRNVRRILDRKNSLNFYWQNTNKFIEEWKHRYLLSSKQQQLYFWSWILCIATIMKYIEIEFAHQLISIPLERETKNQDADYEGIDDSDLQRHIVDYQLWDGFFMPPQNQLQTAQISQNMSEDTNKTFDEWYTSLSRVEPFTKFINKTNYKQRISKTLIQTHGKITCGHSVKKLKKGDILWYSKSTNDIYCNRCATLLQFTECIRKYVLESESSEVIDFMWPWYRNYSHTNDRKKYLKYIAKYNLSHLFMRRDILDTINNDKEDSSTPPPSCWRRLCCKKEADDVIDSALLNGSSNSSAARTSDLVIGRKQVNREEIDIANKHKQIRHLRKFAASVLLQPWDILRNLNVIKSQLQLLFQCEELKIDDIDSWDKWKKKINEINEETREKINEKDRDTILELRHDASFELEDEQKKVFHHLVRIILAEFKKKEDKLDEKDDQTRYYRKFKKAFRMVPKWWVNEHDVLLIELALKFNWNRDEINEELTDPSKKHYYQTLLKSDAQNDEFGEENKYGGDDIDGKKDDFEYRGYQEFQVWCSDWRNIQHRLRFLSFAVCKYLSECRPSIIEIRIPNENQADQYMTSSFIFLNGYIEKVHLHNCKTDKKLLNEMVKRSSTIKEEDEINKARTRDPFMTRHLDFELTQICQAFDLLQYGVAIALFLIKLLARKQSPSLWSALGIVLEYMPYEKARYVLIEEREDLRHGEPQQLKHTCDQIIKGSNFSVHICLFLAEYMDKNAEEDLARFKKWNEFSEYYEEEAGKSINEIESDHLLSVLIDIPLSENVPLIQVALEQNRAQFLNNERINAVLKHVWQTPSGLDPNVDFIRKSLTSTQLFRLLADSPFHFYITPIGFHATIKSLHLSYLFLIFVFISNRIYVCDALRTPEILLWSLNIGYIVYEMIEAYDKGLHAYFTLAGYINYWDLQICIIWIVLFAIRISSLFLDYQHLGDNDAHTNINWSWSVSEAYLMLWGIQAASLSARSLVLFQTSEYFGVLLRMMQRLIVEMMRFMFVLFLILNGFVFGLYYIEGGYIYDDDSRHKTSADDWYQGFKYLFQLTVGAGDFSGNIQIVDDEITAQLFTILYITFATILMMNLLIALMTTTFEQVYSRARTESSFAIAETIYDLSHRSRFMPAPVCIYIFAIAIIVHILNFIPAVLAPAGLNIYNCINHHCYAWFVNFKISESSSCFRCFCCCGSSNIDINDEDVYKLNKRQRILSYYASTIFCCNCFCKNEADIYKIHHGGCYSCIPTEFGAKEKEKDRSSCNGITLNQYGEEYEAHFKYALDPEDTVLLKHLTVDTLFCKYCYRPFEPKHNLDDVLRTPFWALSELISIYLFPFTVWLPLLIVYGIFALFEQIGNVFNTETTEPNVLDHDRQYFQKETLHISNEASADDD